MDCIGVDFFKVYGQIKDCFKVNVVLIQFLIGVEGEFSGIIDFVVNKVYIYKNDFGIDIEEVDVLVDMVDEVVEWWNILMEIVVEIDEVLIEKFFESGEFSVDEFKKGI